jgi:transposase
MAGVPSERPVRILFQDEGRFGRISDRRRCWAPMPSRPQVGHQVVREYVYAVTAVNPFDGKIFSLVLPWVDAEGMSIFLKHTAQAFQDEVCVMILDGAGWHRAKALQVPKTMRLLPLPPYSPELNPVEHIWAWLRENVFKNTAFETLDAVMDTLCKGLKNLSDQPDLVRSLTYFDWLNALSLTYS